jgi:hypothetical protein
MPLVEAVQTRQTIHVASHTLKKIEERCLFQPELLKPSPIARVTCPHVLPQSRHRSEHVGPTACRRPIISSRPSIHVVSSGTSKTLSPSQRLLPITHHHQSTTTTKPASSSSPHPPFPSKPTGSGGSSHRIGIG